MPEINPYEAPQSLVATRTAAADTARPDAPRFRRTILVACCCQVLCVGATFALAAADFAKAASLCMIGYLLLTLGLVVFAMVIRASLLLYAELFLFIISIMLITRLVHEALGEAVMPELNPYEPPQTELAPVEAARSYPLVIKTIFHAQLLCVVLLAILTPMTVVPSSQASHNLLVSSLCVGLALLTTFLIFAAVRFRIGWLLLAEWFLFALPLIIAGVLYLV